MESIRIWRSPYSRFANFVKFADDRNDETVTANQVYTDETLEKISENGFNAIWLHGLLRNLVPSSVFPEFGKNSALHLQNLKDLITRAKKYGIKVFIYMQPPRGLEEDHPFWETHSDVSGHPIFAHTDDGKKIPMRSLCTSTEKVQDYLRKSSAELASELPELGGVILITASEFPSHCYGKVGIIDDKGIPTGNVPQCPRCVEKSPIEVITEIIQCIRDGIRLKSADIKVIAWNWSWSFFEAFPCHNFISNLPDDIIFMAGFERGGEKVILDKSRYINEYSITYSGPSEQFVEETDLAKNHGLEVMAKLQFGTTHELATVPNLPLIGNLFDKTSGMHRLNIPHFMGCWNFGNMLTANSAAFNFFLSHPELTDKNRALTEFATMYFPGCDSILVLQAWEQFSNAGDYYPFNTPFTYNGPINYSVIFPIYPGPLNDIPCGRSWMFDSPRGDDLSSSIYEFTLDELITGMGKVSEEWFPGLTFLKQGLKNCEHIHAKEEISSAAGAYHSFRSVWNTYRSYRLRLEWDESKRNDYLMIAENEIRNLKEFLPYVEADERLGYHGEAFGHMYKPDMIKEKISLLGKQLNM